MSRRLEISSQALKQVSKLDKPTARPVVLAFEVSHRAAVYWKKTRERKARR